MWYVSALLVALILVVSVWIAARQDAKAWHDDQLKALEDMMREQSTD